VLSPATLVWNALYAAALSTIAFGAVILPAGVTGTLRLTGILGVVPLICGVALAGALGRRHPRRPA